MQQEEKIVQVVLPESIAPANQPTTPLGAPVSQKTNAKGFHLRITIKCNLAENRFDPTITVGLSNGATEFVEAKETMQVQEQKQKNAPSKKRPKKKKLPVKLCKNCSTPMKQYQPTQEFCSDKCRTTWWNKAKKYRSIYTLKCKLCGKEFTTQGNKKQIYCSRKCYYDARYRQNKTTDEIATMLPAETADELDSITGESDS